MTTGTEQKLTCEGKAGNPPAKLEWYRDSTMLSSQYTLEGDMVKAEVKITKINCIFPKQIFGPSYFVKALLDLIYYTKKLSLYVIN